MPIQITARREGFRRCGIAHSEKTKTYPDEHFTPAQLRELESESQLIVVRIDNSKPAVISSGPLLEDVLADHLELQKGYQELQGQLDRSEYLINSLSDQLAIELAWSESLQQELEALKVPPVPNTDDQSDKQTNESEGTDKTTKSPAKSKK